MPETIQQSIFTNAAETKLVTHQNGKAVILGELTEENSSGLLDLVDVVRDPIHGDIHLTALERVIVDTPEFQRLRNINQLAMTYIAFPGAVHTRFIHSLGTLHVCSELINTCNKNADIYSRVAPEDHPRPLHITNYATVLARLCALMHDMAHVAFGHTFEKEAQIFDQDEWQDPKRVELLLGTKSNLAECFRTFFKSRNLPTKAADQLREDIKDVLTTKRDEVTELKYPFVHDLVGNTICADLIDYVQRDMYFCGLFEKYGDRFLKYIAVFPVQPIPAAKEPSPGLRPIVDPREFAFPTETSLEGRPETFCRVVLMGYRYNERRVPVTKRDIYSEAIDLVRKRLAVAEKLYFHRTKIVASAMLAEAAVSAGLTSAEDIWEKSDYEVLKKFSNSTNKRTSNLAKRILDRKLFKPIYMVSYHKRDETVPSRRTWDAYERFKTPEKRHELVKRLEKCIALIEGKPIDVIKGSVVISCPDKEMNLKAFDMLVAPSPESEIRRLQVSEHPPTQSEIAAIQDTHKHLWKLAVFVDPTHLRLDRKEAITMDLAGAIEQEIGPPNEVAEFKGAERTDLAKLERRLEIDRSLEKLGVASMITHPHYQELCGIAMRGVSDLAGVDEAHNEFLTRNGYLPPK